MAQDLVELRENIRKQLLASEETFVDSLDVEERVLEVVIQNTSKAYFPLEERRKIVKEITASLVGLDVLEPLMQDPMVDEIMVMGHKKIYTERQGKFCASCNTDCCLRFGAAIGCSSVSKA